MNCSLVTKGEKGKGNWLLKRLNKELELPLTDFSSGETIHSYLKDISHD